MTCIMYSSRHESNDTLLIITSYEKKAAEDNTSAMSTGFSRNALAEPEPLAVYYSPVTSVVLDEKSSLAV